GERHAYRLETTWLATYEVPATIAPQAEPGSHLAGVELSMDTLATTSAEELAAGLGPLADGYSAWLDEQETRVDGLPAAEPGKPPGRPSSRRASAPAVYGPGSSWCPPPLPLITRRHFRRSVSLTRRWRCNGGTPRSPRNGNPTG
ncbi:MAG: hypothetical protein ACREOE_21535, partial [Gemmatimonadales bacterium]